jgi:sphingomyelin phosphodiesterase 2
MDTSMPAEINVISLNCWGLKFISKFRNERLTEIGRRIAEADPAPQIVGLQECWTHQDYQSIRKQTRHILPHGKYYHSGIFGGGLAILSKWPIEESSMFRYPLNGRPTAFYRGDWYVGKGVACAKIRFGTGAKDVVEVFTTHVSMAFALLYPQTDNLSFTPPMNKNRTTPISVTAPPRHGKSRN